MILNVILSSVLILIITGYFYVKRKFKYWEDRGVPYSKPQFPMGALRGVGTSKASNEIFNEVYTELKGKGMFGGLFFFTKPIAIALDLDFVKNVFVKDFQYFHDRGIYVNERDDPLSGHIFSLTGQRWKSLRAKLSPTFTSGKLKMMHNTLLAVGREFQDFLRPIAECGEEIEVKEILARFTTDIIGNVAFGIDCNTLKDPDAEFRRIGKKIFDFTPLEFLKVFFLVTFPNLGRTLRMKINKPEVTEFFLRLLRETIEYREKNSIKRNDFLSLLMEIMKTGKLEGDDNEVGKMTFEELAAQMFLFFVGGFDTSSSTMMFVLYELAQHKDIQERARAEVIDVLQKHGDQCTYEACMEMKYLDRIVNETLRKYTLGDTPRICGQDYKVPGTNYIIEKGTSVIIPLYAIHNDPDIYPDPQKFDPDRFTDENIKSRHPYSWMPFGEGPRICIGMRFALMQIRVGLASLLEKYRVLTSPKTPIPLVVDPSKSVLTPKGGMWLRFENI